jgi:YrbI family 3-deoxy-D-manno-octulosonate 8-phosphate phosphatase
MQTIAFIPLRGGSKSIPGKNTMPLAGRPLAYWVLDAATGSRLIERIFVATDCPDIRRVVEAYASPKIEVVDRGPETATDTASTESAMIEFAAGRDFETMVLIQATSPLLTADDLDRGLETLRREGADSLVSVVQQKRFIWSLGPDGAHPENYQPDQRPRRQDFAPFLVENGAFYICSRRGLLEHGCRLFGRIAVCVMGEDSYHELDEPTDREVVERLLLGRGDATADPLPGRSRLAPDEFRRRAAAIKLVISDVDGVLTDSGMYYAETGDELKKFNTRDGKGFELLRLAGLKTAIITSEDTQIVARRAAKLRIDFLRQGAVDKRPALADVLRQAGVLAEEVAYVGDDLADLAVMELVGLAVCPADAVPSVRAAAHYVCAARGGDGVVRELQGALSYIVEPKRNR